MLAYRKMRDIRYCKGILCIFWIFWRGSHFGWLLVDVIKRFDNSSNSMKRSSIKKASTFKLQAARARFLIHLKEIDHCVVAIKYPELLPQIRSSSQQVFNMCYNFKEDSAFNRGLNYDNRYFGFHYNDYHMTYREFLGDIKEAWLLGDFNSFDPTKHPLQPDLDLGKGWFKVQWDLNDYRLDENSLLQLKTISQKGEQWVGIPPSCNVVNGNHGIYRKDSIRLQSKSKHRISQLLAYTIDLKTMPLEQCLKFIEEEAQLLECYNTVILKNLFKASSLNHKFGLSSQQADQLEDIVQRLSRVGIKVVLQWNFAPVNIKDETSIETIYGKKTKEGWQFDLNNDEAIAFYLSKIAFYFKQFGIRGLHFTKVHNLCQCQNGVLFTKLVNLLCEWLTEDAITLASSKEFIAGLTQTIEEGGYGFSFVYNFKESLNLGNKHEDICELAKQIHATSNCLSIQLHHLRTEDYIYLLFSLMIARKGVFTRGYVHEIRQELQKVLKLRQQEELFTSPPQILQVNQHSAIISRGKIRILFNFEKKAVAFEGNYEGYRVLFSEKQEEFQSSKSGITLSGLNCVLIEEVDA